MMRLILAFSGVTQVMSHGWMRKPLTRLEMAYTHWVSGMPDDQLRWSPSASTGPNSCGAWGTDYMESKYKWQHFYNLAGLDVPVWAPGAEIDVKFQLLVVDRPSKLAPGACTGLIEELLLSRREGIVFTKIQLHCLRRSAQIAAGRRVIDLRVTDEEIFHSFLMELPSNVDGAVAVEGAGICVGALLQKLSG